MSYAEKPKRFLENVTSMGSPLPDSHGYCAGFEVEEWRCHGLSSHLLEWIADYALWGDQLNVHHGNMVERLKRAAARIYNTPEYQKRGEVGELLLHAICRDFFETVPVAPRVFYLTSSNDVVKSFDLVHVRPRTDSFEIWLGEAKFFKNPALAVERAIESIEAHIDAGFLRHEKLILAPQIDPTAPYANEISDIFSEQTSLDALFDNAVFPVCVAAESIATKGSKMIDSSYKSLIDGEMRRLQAKLSSCSLHTKIKLLFLYVPLADKDRLARSFDSKLKAILSC
ncbi:MAG TPA: DUF1837 domain-containing protein [Allosphingosinicella sp.]